MALTLIGGRDVDGNCLSAKNLFVALAADDDDDSGNKI